ncbi:WXG100 family type VII secretion target [Microbacterium sp. W1N]|uniref:WXG100 family type VII secretion target n=1 Tax=Microbacterium festucae TaxID=2977531 RepID=UPI0021C22D7D|nr:WXG100 family type VII secretion target [Microbacterium festucae]MCT9819536.1 WXG100 family type VII secretion target [Microbacterium festucae]
MDPAPLLASAADAAAFAHAGRQLAAARGEAEDLRAAARALAEATAWRSRAAEAYREALADWARELARVAAHLDEAADEVRRAARAAVPVRG